MAMVSLLSAAPDSFPLLGDGKRNGSSPGMAMPTGRLPAIGHAFIEALVEIGPG